MSLHQKDKSRFVPPQEGPPTCFGDPPQVCPRDEDGIIQPQAHCLSCERLKDCLRQALQTQGVLPKPSAPPPVVSRVAGFLKRWSDQKLAKEQTQAGISLPGRE